MVSRTLLLLSFTRSSLSASLAIELYYLKKNLTSHSFSHSFFFFAASSSAISCSRCRFLEKRRSTTHCSLSWLSHPKVSEIPWFFPDFFVTNVQICDKFPWPTELTISQISPDNGPNAPPHSHPLCPFIYAFSKSHATDDAKYMNYIFPDSKWNSLTFPWPWKNFIFPDHFLTCGNLWLVLLDSPMNARVSCS